VPVAAADREAEAAIKRSRRVEIAHGVDDVVDTAGHGFIPSVAFLYVSGASVMFRADAFRQG
jgi:hypothetical protein